MDENRSERRPLPVRIVSGRRWQDDLPAIFAGVIACTALGVSIWQGMLSREYNRLSLHPILFGYQDFTLNIHDSGLFLSNRGGGPAVLRTSQIYLSGGEKRPMNPEGWVNVLRDSGISVQTVPIRWSIETDFVIDAHQQFTLLRLPDDTPPDVLRNVKHVVQTKLTVEICYCSLYNECQRMTYANDSTTNVPASCSVPAK
jgi:hypothetical protein